MNENFPLIPIIFGGENPGTSIDIVRAMLYNIYRASNKYYILCLKKGILIFNTT